MRTGNRDNRVNPHTLSDADLVKLAVNEDARGRDRHKARMVLNQRARERGWS